ncbi:hypothetical protein GCM10020331_023760 [Ectobacillus funiculus]
MESWLVFLGYTRIEAQEPVEKLEKMIAVVEANGATVEQWSWLAKEELDSVQDVHTFYKLLDSLVEKKVAADWKVEQSPEGYKAIAVKNLLIIKKDWLSRGQKENTKDKTFVTYEVKGTEWDDAIFKKMHKIFLDKILQLSLVFKLFFDDKIEGVFAKIRQLKYWKIYLLSRLSL